jgi:SPOR domain
MADGPSFRSSRSGLPPRRDEPSADPARDALSDPLAELARLIGQDEAFGAIVRSSGRQEPRAEPRAEPPPVDASPPSWRARSGPAQAAWERDDRDRYAPPPADDGASRFPRHPLDPQPRPPAAPPAYEPPAQDVHAYDAHGYEAAPAGEETADAGHVQAHPATPHHDAAGEYYGEDGEGHDAHYEGEEDYADAVPERRRGGLVIVASVIGLALVGTAGAFGYWAWSAGPGGHGEPPLIKADTSPNKVVPSTQAGDASGNKRIYDRFGGDKGASAERVVPREETPADVPTPPRQVYPSVGGVYGPAPAGQPAAAAPASAPAAPAPQPSGVPPTGAPHVVRTETIRPGQVASVDLGQPVAPPLAAAPPGPAAAAPAKQPAARAKQGAGQPVALAEPAAPARNAAPTGGYVVQVSSQRTEEEAIASFKALATKYAAVFGDRQPLIKRADMGDKGVHYRAQVGPFPTQDQANHFCSNLKIAGGQCFVQKN